MTLIETTELYAAVLRQLLPVGGYDTATSTNIAQDVYAHAKALASVDLDAKRLFNVIDDIPAELVEEFEVEYGLPLACSINNTRSVSERISIIKWVKNSNYGLTYYRELFEFFGVELVGINKPRPMQCTAPCTFPVNTEQLRYKLRLILRNGHTADVNCIIGAYFPAFLEINVREV